MRTGMGNISFRKWLRLVAAGLSLLLVVSGVTPAVSVQAATPEAYIFLKGSSPHKKYTKNAPRYLYVGGKSVNLDYYIEGKTAGAGGKWTSSDTNIVTVDKSGVIKAVGNGSATVSYTFKYQGQSYKITAYIVGRTRAQKCTVKVVDPTDFDGTMEVGGVIDIDRTLTPIAKAKAINPKIKSTYKTYGTLYDDEACTVEHDGSVATMAAKFVITGESDGVVYFKANSRNSKTNMDYSVNSNVIKITVGNGASTTTETPKTEEPKTEDPKTEEPKTEEPKTEDIKLGASQTDVDKIKVTSTQDISKVTIKLGNTVLTQKTGSPEIAADKKSAVISLPGNYQAATYTVFINDATKGIDVACTTRTIDKIVLDSNYAVLDKEISTVVNGVTTYPKATVKYRVYDQFGIDITHNASYPMSDFQSGGIFQIKSAGVLEFQFTFTPVVGTKYDVTLIHRTTGKVMTASVELAKPAHVEKVSYAGIYKYDVSKGGYVLMADGSTSNMAEGDDAIVGVGGSASNTKVNGAYYLLFKAEDQYGGNAAGPGVGLTSLVVNVSPGLTNLLLDTITYGGVTQTQSMDAISVNNADYLAYPLKSGSYKEGSATIFATAVSSTNSESKQVTATITVGAAKGVKTLSVSATETLYEDKNTYLDYSAVDTYGNSVTDYATLVDYCKLSDNGTEAVFPVGSSIINSNYKSEFAWVRQDDGSAKLRYTPKDQSLSANGTYVDTILTMQGTVNMGNVTFTVYPKPLPMNIYGVKTDAALGAIIGGNKAVLRLRDIQVVDQYGAEMNSELLKKSGYSILIKNYTNSGGFVENAIAQTTITFNASATDSQTEETGIYQPLVSLTTASTAGSASFSIVLYHNNSEVGSVYSVTMRSVDGSSLVRTSYLVSSMDSLNNKDNTVHYFEVTGLSTDGTRIAIPKERCTVYGTGYASKFITEAVTGSSISYSGIQPNKVLLGASDGTKEGLNLSSNSNGARELSLEYTIVIDDGYGTNLTATVKISDESSYAASLEVRSSGTVKLGGYIWQSLLDQKLVTAKDQYGKEYTSAQFATNKDAVRITVSGGTGVTTEKNGTENARITAGSGTVTVRINVNDIDTKTISLSIQ